MPANQLDVKGYLYRTMEADLKDLFRYNVPIEDIGGWKIEELTKDHWIMRHLVVHCALGKEFTWLMPCCTTWDAVRHWYGRADCSTRRNRGWMIRMDPNMSETF